MKRWKMLSVLASALVLGIGLPACGENEEDLLNAELPSGPQYGRTIDLPGATGSVADPHVIEVDGTWYLYPTTTGVSIECWRSDDFENWEYEGVVWGPAPAGSWNDSGVWAPEVFEQEGLFYLYYTANEKIGVAVADSPVGPFEEVYDHPLIGGGHGGSGGNSIDAHMIRDADGQLYLYATAYIPLTCLRVFPMADPVTVGGPWRLLFCTNPLTWEGFINEAPWMVVHEGLYYLMYSGNGANRSAYSLGYATADSPMGPFTKYENNPIFHQDPEYDFYGPGHNSVTTGPDGNLWMFYHTKVNDRVNYDRLIRKNKIAFTENGQLYVDVGLGPPPPLQR